MLKNDDTLLNELLSDENLKIAKKRVKKIKVHRESMAWKSKNLMNTFLNTLMKSRNRFEIRSIVQNRLKG